MLTRTHLLAAVPLALALAACSSDGAGTEAATSSGGSSGATARPETPEGAKPAPLRALELPELEGWVREEASGGMRLAQYALPAAEGESDGASLVVFAFAGGVGDFEANLARWCEQIVQPDGTPTKDRAMVSQTTVAGHPAPQAELSGTYSAPQFMGGGPPKTDWTMVQTFVEGEGQTWTIRLLGPKKAVERARADYRRFLAGIRAG